MPRTTNLRRASTSLRDPAISQLVDEFSKNKVGRSFTTFNKVPLQSRNVKNILLVSSAYDLFIFEEGGGFSDALYSEYQSLKLRQSPQITRVSTLYEALDLISASCDPNAVEKVPPFDLVICFLRRAEGMDVWNFLEEIRTLTLRLPITLLASNEHELNNLDPRVDHACRLNIHKTFGWENRANAMEHIWSWPFLWQGDMGLILALIKIVEDRLNVEDIFKGHVRAILLVEDNVQFYSAFLPILYKLVYQLTHHVLNASPSQKKRIEDRLKRPKILLANSYEEAVELFDRTSDNLLGVITDVGYPREGLHSETAGLDFVKFVKAKRPNLPILVQSIDPANEQKADNLGARFLLKSDPQLLNNLKSFMEISLGFGPFLFRQGHGEKIIHRATNLVEFGTGIQTIPDDCIVYHMKNGHFQTWFSAHAWFELAEECAQLSIPPTDCRNWLLERVAKYLKMQSVGMVVEFDPCTYLYEPDALHFARIGSGSLGGKAHALAYLYSITESYGIKNMFPGTSVCIPKSLVLATGIFSIFMQTEGLYKIALDEEVGDEEVVQSFSRASLPTDVVSLLRIFVAYSSSPLAVRSSSVFEDAVDKPYAGVFETFLLPNNDTDLEMRLGQLVHAVKMVYASAYKSQAQAYMRAAGSRPEQVQMAVLIQELAGSARGSHFFPSLSGVAGSYDVYAQAPLDPNDGFCEFALGLGGTVVGGEYCARFSPSSKVPLKSLVQEGSQSKFLALPLHNANKTIYSDILLDATEDIATFPRSSFASSSSATIPSTNSMDSTSSSIDTTFTTTTTSTITDTTTTPTTTTTTDTTPTATTTAAQLSKQRITIAELVREEGFPLTQLISLLLKIGSSAMSCRVEMEFAIDILDTPDREGNTVKFTILQMRAMPQALNLHFSFPHLTFDSSTHNMTISYSSQALGHGHIEDIWDIIYVPPDGLTRNKTHDIAHQIAKLTQKLHEEKRKYVLIGPGRWGTCNSEMGIPVTWQDIRGAVCIVEMPILPDGSACVPSQGSHFFQNITSFCVMYFTIDKNSGVNHKWLSRQISSSPDGGCVRHIPLNEPIEVVADGNTRCGVIMQPGFTHEDLIPNEDES